MQPFEFTPPISYFVISSDKIFAVDLAESKLHRQWSESSVIICYASTYIVNETPMDYKLFCIYLHTIELKYERASALFMGFCMECIQHSITKEPIRQFRNAAVPKLRFWNNQHLRISLCVSHISGIICAEYRMIMKTKRYAARLLNRINEIWILNSYVFWWRERWHISAHKMHIYCVISAQIFGDIATVINNESWLKSKYGYSNCATGHFQQIPSSNLHNIIHRF